MFVWVASFPRSGSNLTITALQAGWGARTDSVFTEFEAAVAAGERRPTRPAKAAVIERMRAEPGPGTGFLKTHLIPHASAPEPALLVVRDGRDALVSLAHLTREQNPALAAKGDFADTLSRLTRRRWVPGGWGRSVDWSASVAAWRERRGPLAVIRFEQLREDPIGTVAAGLDELGIDLGAPEGRMPPIEAMRAGTSSGVVREGGIGGWREQMGEEARQEFAARHGETLVALGYESSRNPSSWS